MQKTFLICPGITCASYDHITSVAHKTGSTSFCHVVVVGEYEDLISFKNSEFGLDLVVLQHLLGIAKSFKINYSLAFFVL